MSVASRPITCADGLGEGVFESGAVALTRARHISSTRSPLSPIARRNSHSAVSQGSKHSPWAQMRNPAECATRLRDCGR